MVKPVESCPPFRSDFANCLDLRYERGDETSSIIFLPAKIVFSIA